MSKGKPLIETIKARAAGRPHDEDMFRETVEKLAASSYHQRYMGLAPPPKGYSRAKSGKTASIPPNVSKLDDGTLIVGRDCFLDLCWQAMNSSLLYKVADLEFIDDSRLAGYLKKAFETLLQKEINKLTPGLETRTRQILRVLKRLCVESGRKGMRCWRLKTASENPGHAAAFEELRRAGKSIPPPLKRPRSKDSAHGVSYSDNEVALYLSKLIERSGGAVRHNDLIEYLKKVFEIEGIRELDLPAGPAGQERPRLSMDHRLVALDIFNALTLRLRDLYGYIVIEGLSGSEVAEKMGASEASVSAWRKKLHSVLERHLHDPGDRFDPNECEAILRRLSELIYLERH